MPCYESFLGRVLVLDENEPNFILYATHLYELPKMNVDFFYSATTGKGDSKLSAFHVSPFRVHRFQFSANG